MNEYRKDYLRKYRKRNKKRLLEYGRRYYQEHKEEYKKWRKENKEYIKECNKKWREKNKVRKKLGDREYFLNNRKKVNEYHKKYKKENPKRVSEWYKKYNGSPKGKLNFTKQNHLRLSKKFGNEFKLSQKDIKKIFERDKVCVYCGKSRHLELDHIVPLSKGGKSIFNNFVVACRYCNPSKSNKDVFEWCKLKGIEIPKVILKLLPRN